MKKYVLTNDTIKIGRKTLHRIVALKAFSNVKIGDLGGYVESESNLSQEGDCWVDDNARVYDNAEVYGNAHVYDNADVYGNARVHGNAEVCGNARVYGNADVKEDVKVYDNALVYDEADLFGLAEIYDNAQIYGRACIFGTVCENAKVYGVCTISGNSYIDSNANIGGYQDYGTIDGFGPNNRDNISFFKLSGGDIRVYSIGGFDGTLEEFETFINTMEDVKYSIQYELIAALIKTKFM